MSTLPETNKTATLTTSNQSCSLEKVYIPAKISYNDVEYEVKSIQTWAFDKGTFSKLIFESPTNITSIGDWTFAECDNVAEVVLPEGLTDLVLWRAFGKMNGLKKITLPTTLNLIGEYTFSADPALNTIIFKGSTPPSTIGSQTFAESTVLSNITIVVPDDALSAYENTILGTKYNFTNDNSSDVNKNVIGGFLTRSQYQRMHSLRGGVVAPSDLYNGQKIILQVASRIQDTPYFMKVNSSGTNVWSCGADSASVWQLIATGKTGQKYHSSTVPTYYMYNLSSKKYVKQANTGDMTDDIESAAEIAFFTMSNPPYDLAKYTDYDIGRTDASTVPYDVTNDKWFRNDFGNISTGSLDGGGTHNYYWNIYAYTGEGSIINQEAITDNITVGIQAASTSELWDYYLCETENTIKWIQIQPTGKPTTWELVPSGKTTYYNGNTATAYYLRNTATGNYIESPKNGTLTKNQNEACPIGIYSAGNPPEGNDVYSYHLSGWTDNSVILYKDNSDGSGDFWFGNNEEKRSSGLLSESYKGTYTWQWNLVKRGAEDYELTDGAIQGKGLITKVGLTNAVSNVNSFNTIDLRQANGLLSDVTASAINDVQTGNILAFTPTQPAVTGQNIINNSSCESLVLTDKATFVLNDDDEFTASSATYTRNMTSGVKWGTIMLPYDVDANDDVAFYSIASESDGVLTVTKADKLTAGTPALFKTNGATSVTFSASPATVKPTTQTATGGGLTLVGTYTKDTIDVDNTYYIKDDKFYSKGDDINFIVNPFRAYMKSDGSAKSNAFSIVVDDDPTGITTAATSSEASDEIEGVYSVNGVKLSDLQKGINIIRYRSGKTQKVILK